MAFEVLRMIATLDMDGQRKARGEMKRTEGSANSLAGALRRIDDAAKTWRKVEEGLERIRDALTKTRAAAAKPITVKVKLEGDREVIGRLQTLKRFLGSLGNNSPPIKVDAETRSFYDKIRRVEARLKALSEGASPVRVLADTQRARSEVQQLVNWISNTTAAVLVGAATGDAQRAAELLKAYIDRLTSHIEVKAHVRAALAALEFVRQKAAGIKGVVQITAEVGAAVAKIEGLAKRAAGIKAEAEVGADTGEATRGLIVVGRLARGVERSDPNVDVTTSGVASAISQFTAMDVLLGRIGRRRVSLSFDQKLASKIPTLLGDALGKIRQLNSVMAVVSAARLPMLLTALGGGATAFTMAAGAAGSFAIAVGQGAAGAVGSLGAALALGGGALLGYGTALFRVGRYAFDLTNLLTDQRRKVEDANKAVTMAKTAVKEAAPGTKEYEEAVAGLALAEQGAAFETKKFSAMLAYSTPRMLALNKEAGNLQIGFIDLGAAIANETAPSMTRWIRTALGLLPQMRPHIVEMVSDMNGVTNSFLKAMTTGQGLRSVTKILLGIKQAGVPALQAVTGALRTVVNVFSVLVPTGNSVVEMMARASQAAARWSGSGQGQQRIADIWALLVQRGTQLAHSAWNIAQGFWGVVKALTETGTPDRLIIGFQGLTAQFRDLMAAGGEGREAIKAFMADAQPVLTAAWHLVKTLTEEFFKTVGAIAGMRNEAQNMGSLEAILYALADAAESFGHMLREEFEHISPLIPGLIQGLGKIAEVFFVAQPPLVHFLKMLNWLLEAFTGLPVETQRTIASFASFTMAFGLAGGAVGALVRTLLGPLTGALGVVNTVTGKNVTVWKVLKGALSGVGRGIKSFGGFVLRTAVPALGRFAGVVGGRLVGLLTRLPLLLRGIGLALRFMLGPWGLVATAAVAAAVLIWRNWDKIRPVLEKIGRFLKGAFSAAWQGLKKTVSAAWQGITSLVSRGVRALVAKFKRDLARTKGIASAAWKGVKAATMAVWNFLTKAVPNAARRLASGALKAWNGLKSAASRVWGAVSSAVMKALRAVGAFVVREARQTVSGAVKVWRGLKSAVVAVWRGLGGAARATWSAVKTVVLGVGRAVAAGAGRVWRGVSSVVVKSWNSVKAQAGRVWGGIKNLLLKLWNGVKSAAGKAWNAVTKSIVSAWNAVSSRAKSSWGRVRDAIVSAWKAILRAVSGALSSLGKAISKRWESVKQTTARIWGSIRKFFSAWWEAEKRGWGRILGALRTLVSKAWNGIKTTSSRIWGGIKKFFAGFWEAEKRGWTRVLTTLRSLISKAWNFIKNTSSKVFNGIKRFLQGFWTAVTKLWQTSTNRLKSTLSSAWNTIKNTTSKVYKAIRSFLTGWWNSLVKFVGRLLTTIRNKISEAWNAVKSTTSKLWEQIRSALVEKATAAKNKVTSLIQGLRNTLSNLWTEISDRAKTFGDNFARMLGEKFGGAVNRVRSWLGSLAYALSNVLKAIGMGDLASNLSDRAQQLKEPLKFARGGINRMGPTGGVSDGRVPYAVFGEGRPGQGPQKESYAVHGRRDNIPFGEAFARSVGMTMIPLNQRSSGLREEHEHASRPSFMADGGILGLWRSLGAAFNSYGVTQSNVEPWVWDVNQAIESKHGVQGTTYGGHGAQGNARTSIDWLVANAWNTKATGADKARGDSIVGTLASQFAKLTQYVIWYGKANYSGKGGGGWQPYTGGGGYAAPSSPSGFHYDHVHWSATPNGQPGGYSGSGGSAGGGGFFGGITDAFGKLWNSAEDLVGNYFKPPAFPEIGLGVVGEGLKDFAGSMVGKAKDWLVEKATSMLGFGGGGDAYPGGDRSKVAKWMAAGARARKMPGELPVMTSLVETGLRNLNYGDRDSLGYFQQRASWGSASQRTNPEYALDAFLDAAQGFVGKYSYSASGLGNWAQAVQVSAFPDRYAQQWGAARSLIGRSLWGYPNASQPVNPAYRRGGVIPGVEGAMKVIAGHAGERVLPVGVVDAFDKLTHAIVLWGRAVPSMTTPIGTAAPPPARRVLAGAGGRGGSGAGGIRVEIRQDFSGMNTRRDIDADEIRRLARIGGKEGVEEALRQIDADGRFLSDRTSADFFD